MSLKALPAVCVCALAVGFSFGRLIDNSKDQVNVGKRPVDIVYKNADGKQEGSFYITYDSATDSGSQGYYADYKRSTEEDDDDEDDSDDDYYEEDGEYDEDEYSDDEYTEESRRKKRHKKKTKRMDASTAEAEFIEYDDKKGKVIHRLEDKRTHSNKTGDNKNKRKNINVKESLGNKKKTKIDSKVKRDGTKQIKKNNEKKEQDRQTLNKNKTNRLQKDQSKKDKEKETKQKEISLKNKTQKYSMQPTTKIGKIKQRKQKKLEKEKKEAEEDEDSYNEEFVQESGKSIQNDLDDEYDYDDLKEQIEKAESAAKSLTDYTESEEKNKKARKKKEPRRREEKNRKNVRSEKRFRRKEQKVKVKGRNRIPSGKRIGKSRVNKLRFKGRSSKDATRRRDKVKEGISSYKRTEDTRIFNEDKRKSSEYYGRNRAFRDMEARQRVRDYVRRGLERNGRRNRGVERSLANKENAARHRNIKRQRLKVAAINKKGPKLRKVRRRNG